MRKDRSGTMVYSTETGNQCPDCGQARPKCRCGTEVPAPRGDGIVRIRRETKGRKGKCVTIVDGLPLQPQQLKTLGKELKGACGSGGTVKDGRIEIQGDHRNTLLQTLRGRGWTVKQSGG